MLFVPVGIGAGVALYFGLTFEPPAWPFALGLGAALALSAAIRRSLAARAACLGVACVLAGLLAGTLSTRRMPPMPALPRRATIITGVVRDIDRRPEGGIRVTLRSVAFDAAPPITRTVRVRLRPDDGAAVADGDLVRVRALLRPPAPPAYPGARDTERDAFFSGLGGAGWAIGPVTVLVAHPPSGLAAWWRGVRDRAADRFVHALPGSAGPIAATLMVGISTGISPADRAAFTNAGLAHLLAVAGLHVGIVMGFTMGAVRLGLAAWPAAALRLPVRALAAIAALAAGGLYMLLTGAHLPIIRSFCMAALATLAIMLGRRAISMRGLAFAATVILLAWPAELTGVSFQMSFAAVACLIAGYEVLRPLFASLATSTASRRLALHIAALATTSLIAGAASSPFAAYHFGQVQSWFVVANVIAVPITAVWIMPWGLVSLALMPLGLERLPLVPMGWGIELVLAIGRRVSAWPGAVLAVPHMPLAGLIAVGAGIALLCLLRSPLRRAGLAPLLLGIVSPLLARPPDLVVSDDARLIALAGAGRDAGMAALLIERHGSASKFTLAADQILYAAPGTPRPLPSQGALGPASCTPDACRIAFGRGTILLDRAENATPDCGALALVAPFPLRDACPGVPRIDRFTVWRDGAAAIRLVRGTVTIETDRSWRGARPWVAPPPARRTGARPTLPMAAGE